jgi:hypothetical protein
MLFSLAGLWITAAIVPPTSYAAQSAVPFQQGMTYASWARGEYSSPASDLTLSQIIKPMGINWISVIVTCYQDTIQSTKIDCTDDATPSDEDLAHVTQFAHNLDIKVMLKPHVDLMNDPGHWRGEINFGGDESAWKTWFESYTQFITHYAALARALDVDYFVVGTELEGTYPRANEWRAVIAAVRALYLGPLTYAGSETGITWWDALDAIGIDAYYSLTTTNEPTLTDLKVAWTEIASRLEALSKQWNRPIIFTELGYPSVDGANREPATFDQQAPLDLQEQADCYRAAFAVLKGKPWWAGNFSWTMTPNPLQGGANDKDYTIRGKPAEDVLRTNYGAPARPTPTPVPAFVEDGSTQEIIYGDALGNGWENWSWNSSINLQSSDHSGQGSAAIKLSLQPWGALSLHHAPLDTSPYYWLEFY